MSDIGKISPVFILGTHRSGTTLLQSLLDGHPQLLVDVGESRFFPRFYAKSKRKNFKDRLEIAERELLHMFNPRGIYYQKFLTHIPHQDVNKYFLHNVHRSQKQLKDFLESYIYAVGQASGQLSQSTKYWVEKTPNNEYYLDKIRKWWPDAYYIYIVRDPKDVYASYKTRDIKHGREITPVETFIFTWRKSLRSVTKNFSVIGKGRSYLQKYEDLVRDVQISMGGVASFLNIQVQDILTNPTKGGGVVTWGGNPADDRKSYLVRSDSIGRWRTVLTESDVQKIECSLFTEMSILGYPICIDQSPLLPDIRLQIHNVLREARFRLKRY